MRLWTLHPKYLDPQGLVACWREGLLAQKVLQGKTKGYRNHPQLLRFKVTSDPVGALAIYLHQVRTEAMARGYRFDGSKIARARWQGKLPAPKGQLLYEWEHLLCKLRKRSPERGRQFAQLSRPQAHPLFRVVAGPVANWEKR